MIFRRKKKPESATVPYSSTLYSQLESLKTSGKELSFPYPHKFTTDFVHSEPVRIVVESAQIPHTEEYALAGTKPYLTLKMFLSNAEQVNHYLAFEERLQTAKLQTKDGLSQQVPQLRKSYAEMREWVATVTTALPQH